MEHHNGSTDVTPEGVHSVPFDFVWTHFISYDFIHSVSSPGQLVSSVALPSEPVPSSG